MEYIIFKRFKGTAICGEVDLPARTICQAANGVIFYQKDPLCLATSTNAHEYFMRNDDGKGMQRGELIEYIITTLALNDEKHDKRWEAIINDPTCQAYRRPEHSDVWLWNHAFYNTTIEALTYIKSLIEEV